MPREKSKQAQGTGNLEKVGGKLPKEMYDEFNALCASEEARKLGFNATAIHRMCMENGMPRTSDQLKAMVAAKESVK